MTVNRHLSFLLLQVRNPNDPMREHEVDCFARALPCDVAQVHSFDLLSDAPGTRCLQQHDVVLLGGSGHYSATGDAPWLDRALEALGEIHAAAKPTFASCWGFQAMARATGGRVISDLPRAEVGTVRLRLTSVGLDDPIFAPLGPSFHAQAGHEDHVVKLPPDADRLASTDLVRNQAYRFRNRPIYCTQFHPELRRADLISRVQIYPEYVERITGQSVEEFMRQCVDTPETEALLSRFVRFHFDS